MAKSLPSLQCRACARFLWVGVLRPTRLRAAEPASRPGDSKPVSRLPSPPASSPRPGPLETLAPSSGLAAGDLDLPSAPRVWAAGDSWTLSASSSGFGPLRLWTPSLSPPQVWLETPGTSLLRLLPGFGPAAGWPVLPPQCPRASENCVCLLCFGVISVITLLM